MPAQCELATRACARRIYGARGAVDLWHQRAAEVHLPGDRVYLKPVCRPGTALKLMPNKRYFVALSQGLTVLVSDQTSSRNQI